MNWWEPDHNTLCRRQRMLLVSLPYRGSKEPLHLLVDSTGIKLRGAMGSGLPTGPRKPGVRHARKHGGARQCVWSRVHLGIDEGDEAGGRLRWGVSPTNREVRAVEGEPANAANVGDTPVLLDLLDQIAKGEKFGSVPTDGACDVSPHAVPMLS